MIDTSRRAELVRRLERPADRDHPSHRAGHGLLLEQRNGDRRGIAAIGIRGIEARYAFLGVRAMPGQAAARAGQAGLL